jgi:hypothetical protein
MNIDRDPADARFVVERLGITYSVLRADSDEERGYPAACFGYPTLLILDKDGVVRDLHVGYSATLREDVTRSIDALLGR